VGYPQEGQIAQGINIISNEMVGPCQKLISLDGVDGVVISGNHFVETDSVAIAAVYGTAQATGINLFGNSYYIPHLAAVEMYQLAGSHLISHLGTIEMNGRKTSNGTAAPTTGTCVRGDICWNIAPSAGGSSGWQCVTSGTFSAATDNTGDTDGSTAVITGMTDTSDFNIGEFVTVSAGFATTGPFRIVAKAATSVTVDTNSTSAQSNVTVATPDPVWKAMASLAA
jgi:hypothetical protein